MARVERNKLNAKAFKELAGIDLRDVPTDAANRRQWRPEDKEALLQLFDNWTGTISELENRLGFSASITHYWRNRKSAKREAAFSSLPTTPVVRRERVTGRPRNSTRPAQRTVEMSSAADAINLLEFTGHTGKVILTFVMDGAEPPQGPDNDSAAPALDPNGANT